ncbi:MAG: fused MFS/spermidine synthase [Nanoarchaeota archaeon]|nr:fused MFS/spermidine synthase [Nanoarchaeota archaeon]
MDKKREKLLFYSITALGISSVITQILLMREFLSVFYGNELVLGMILANWLLLTGVGAWLGRYADRFKGKLRLIIYSQIAIAFLPFVNILLIRWLRNVIFPVGSMVGIVEIFLSSFILLLPYCIISGFLLTLFCTVFSFKQDAKAIGRVYFIDNIGDILGGILFSFILVFLLNPFQMIFFIMFINLLAALLLAIFIKNTLLEYVLIALLALSVLAVAIDFDTISTKMQYEGQELIANEHSLYGHLVVTRSEDQLNFYENGVILFSTENTISNEETVHYAMVQHPSPKRVLLISGGVAGTLDEILKYDVEHVTYVELDPKVIGLGQRYASLPDDDRITIVNKDARTYIKEIHEEFDLDLFDVIIIDLPDPGTAQLNRFYTLEFFEEAKRILNHDGILATSLISTENYINPEAVKLNSVLYNTLQTIFSNTIIIPGTRNHFIASENDLTYGIAGMIEALNISTSYVNAGYLMGEITEERVRYLFSTLDPDVGLNLDFEPASYYHHLLYWLSHFKVNYFLLIGIILAITLVFVIRLRPVSFAIFTTGFAASGLEVILLIGFQIIYGFIYHMIGIIITMFMLGLAVGSFYMNRTLKKRKIGSLIKLELLIAGLAIALPFILIASGSTAIVLVPLLTFLVALLTGMEFPLASKLCFSKVSKTAASLYNADLVGAFVGALLVSALLLPLLGLLKVCLLISGLNLVSAGILFIKRNSYKA